MSNALIDNSTLMDIADAIRAKLETQDTMLPSEMAGNIRQISGGGGGTYQQKTVHPSAVSQTVNPDSGYDALSSVTVEGMELQSKSATPSGVAQTIEPDSGKDGLSQVTIAAATLQAKSATAGSTAQTITADAGYYGLSSVEVAAISMQSKSVTPSSSAQTVTPDSGYSGLSSVEVAAVPQPALGTKNITQNGTYTAASDNLDGFSEVTVNVSGSAQTVIAKLLWTNSSPTEDFAAQTVSLDLTDYDAVIICGKGQKGQTVPNPFPGNVKPVSNQCYVKKGADGYIPFGTQASGYASYNWRKVTVSNSGIVFSTGYIQIGTNTSPTSNAAYAIPTEIYGVKEATTTTKNITTNGTYNASSDSADGYSSVVVNVPSSQSEAVDLLWTNPSTSTLAAQTISLDLTDYRYIMIRTISDTSAKIYNTFVTSIYSSSTNYTDALEFAEMTYAGYPASYKRRIGVGRDSVKFDIGYAYYYDTSQKSKSSAGFAIPLKIWGLKTSVTGIA